MSQPLPITASLRLLPDAFHTDVITRIANHLMRGQDIAERLDYLEGKRICLSVSDTGNNFHIRVGNRRLNRCSSHAPWDIRISGKLEDFWRLANRSEDPDTLFFNRDLELEGDTDAALYLKNLLASVEFDFDRHLQEVAGPRLAPHVRKVIERSTLLQRAQRLVRA